VQTDFPYDSGRFADLAFLDLEDRRISQRREIRIPPGVLGYLGASAGLWR
jgi:hypothetical protein